MTQPGNIKLTPIGSPQHRPTVSCADGSACLISLARKDGIGVKFVSRRVPAFQPSGSAHLRAVKAEQKNVHQHETVSQARQPARVAISLTVVCQEDFSFISKGTMAL